MELKQFADAFYVYQGQRLTNAQRPYMVKILEALGTARRTVLCTARQCEKSTNLLKVITHHLIVSAPTTALFIMPRKEQLHRMISSRLLPMISQSPILNRMLLPRKRQSLKHLIFENGSELISDSCFLTADAARGVTAKLVLLDEYQDCAPDSLAILEEAQSHQDHPRTILSGTAKLAQNPLELAFVTGTANVWMVNCRGCNRAVQANEQILSADAYRCPACKAVLNPADGSWLAQNPHSTFAESFRVPQLITPWLSAAQLSEKKRLYSLPQFRNEVLGESVTSGDLSLTLSDLRACCMPREAADALERIPPNLFLPRFVGIDWGNSAVATTSICVGVLDPYCKFNVLNWWRLPPGNEPKAMLQFVAEIILRMNVTAVAADSQGNGAVFRPLLLEKLQQDIPFYGMAYTEEADFSYKHEIGNRHLLAMNKTKAIADVVFRVRSRQITFPRAEDVETYLVEIASEQCVPDERRRVIRYERTPGRPDDALHSLTYALSIANHRNHGRPYL